MNLVIQNQQINNSINNISISNFTIKANDKPLFLDSSLVLVKPSINGLIGKNGCGKTTLLKKLADREFPIDKKIMILYVEQEIEETDENPIQYIFKSNRRLNEINNRVIELESKMSDDIFSDEMMEEYQDLQNELNQYEIQKQEPMIKRILYGLGFSDPELYQSCKLFSGGWRMRIALAKALYMQPDILLLDEPTNHLDLEAVIWLSDYLDNWKNIALVVSHNVGFLNRVCTNMMNIEDFKIVNYRGNYNSFKKNFKNKQITITKKWNNFEKKLKKFKKKSKSKNDIQDFIKKNIVPKPEKKYNLKIRFPETSVYTGPIIQVEDLSFSYNNDTQIFNKINFRLDMDSRITLVGKNGSGKSTLLKLIVDKLKPNQGRIWRAKNLKIGYYDQHFENSLPLDMTPVEYLESIFPKQLMNMDKVHTIRGYLGSMRLNSREHLKKIKELSGGQKARVAMVKLIFTMPHFILLDEPTNHLDLETIEALIEGLKNFNGGIMVITHEEELITKLDSQLWILENKKINFYRDTFDDYCDKIIDSIK